MTKYRDQILDYMEFAIRRDGAKGGDGWRTTTDVAERLGVKASVARRALYAMLDMDLVDYADGPGALLWRLAWPDDDNGEGQPVPVAMNDNVLPAWAIAVAARQDDRPDAQSSTISDAN